MVRGLSFVLILLSAIVSTAQVRKSCTLILNEAEDLYSAGRLLEIETQGFLDCLNNGGFTDGEEIRARKLLTKVAIFTDNEPKAEQELVELLTIDPVHQLVSEDPQELAVLKSKFRTWPVYRFEFYVGGNFSFTTVAQEFETLSTNYTKDYVNTLGVQGGVRMTKHLKDFVTGLEVGAGFEWRSSGYTVDARFGPDVNNPYYQTNIINSQTMIRLPVLARYNVNYTINGKFIPYGFIGASMDYIATARYSDASRTGGTSFTLDSNDADLKSLGQVNDFGVSIFAGGGFKFGGAKKGNFFFLEARFDKSIFLYNVPDERYSNDKIYGDLQYVEDDVYVDMLSAQFGYIWSIFKPEKLSK